MNLLLEIYEKYEFLVNEIKLTLLSPQQIVFRIFFFEFTTLIRFQSTVSDRGSKASGPEAERGSLHWNRVHQERRYLQ